MTTKAAERLYLVQHQREMEGRQYAVYNPSGVELTSLPVIYGFNNGGSPGWYSAIALADDGLVLGEHICSDEAYMPHDLGILEGTRPDRHEKDYRRHYPSGYRMEFVASSEIELHEGLRAAIAKAKAAAPEEKE